MRVSRRLSAALAAYLAIGLDNNSGAFKISFEPSFGAIDAKPAFFGNPPWGHTIRAQLVYGSPGSRDGCKRIEPSRVRNWPVEGDMPVVAMLRRGGCPFKAKVRHAQEVGAKAAIIVDNMVEPFVPFMAADGYTADVTIPAVCE